MLVQRYEPQESSIASRILCLLGAHSFVAQRKPQESRAQPLSDSLRAAHATHRVPLGALESGQARAAHRYLLPGPRRGPRLRRKIVPSDRTVDHDHPRRPPLLYSETVFTETT